MAILYDDFGGREQKAGIIDDDAIEIFLDPGEYFVGDSSFMVRTLLGSCVSITLWHARMRYGAMCHFLLSSRPKNKVRTDELNGRFADEVLGLMLRELEQADVPVRQCQAKIFGGGNMFPHLGVNDTLNIGKQNGETARMLLRSHGIPVITEDLFGVGHREVIFHVGSGDVWIKHVKNTPAPVPKK